MLSKGEPVVIDDYNNDEIGCVLVSRASKAIWGKAQVTIRNQTITPNANLPLCTNEEIKNLKVEGKNKAEIYQKLSVIDLGEEPMSRSDSESKGEKITEIFKLAKVVRKLLPSFFGLMLQVCGSYISAREFEAYKEITNHERLGNILKNVKKLYDKLNEFCEEENIEKPKSLKNKLDTSCLTNKSELALKFKNPEQIVEVLMAMELRIVITEHKSKEGIAFSYKSLAKLPWYYQSISNFKKDGLKVYSKMRTRQLDPNKLETSAAFLSFESLRPEVIEKIKDYSHAVSDDDSETAEPGTGRGQVDLRVIIQENFESECRDYETIKLDRIVLAEQYVLSLGNQKFDSETAKPKYKCKDCGFIAKSKGGLTTHVKKCKKK